MAKGIFPQMTIPDIINALAGWGISVSPEQLKMPTPDFVEGVYCACLQQVTDLNHDSLRDPVQNSLNVSQVEDKVCVQGMPEKPSYLLIIVRTFTLPH